MIPYLLLSEKLFHILAKSKIQKRIDLDTHNAYHFNHFKNGKNWDILKKTAEKPKNIFGY